VTKQARNHQRINERLSYRKSFNKIAIKEVFMRIIKKVGKFYKKYGTFL